MFINFVNDIFEIVLNPGLCDTLVGFLMSAGHTQNKREGRRKYFLPPSRFSKLTYKFRISHRLNKQLFMESLQCLFIKLSAGSIHSHWIIAGTGDCKYGILRRIRDNIRAHVQSKADGSRRCLETYLHG